MTKCFIAPNPRPAETYYVLTHLSEKSQEDIFGSTDISPEELVKYYDYLQAQRKCFVWVFYWDGKPAAILGASQDRPGVWSVFGMGTDDWKKVWRQVTVTAKRDMFAAVEEVGAHRAYCVSPASHEDTHRWLRYLGANHEAEMPAYGNKGEDYIMFTWLPEG